MAIVASAVPALGASAHIARSIRVDTSDEAFDIRPRRPHGQRFIRIHAWPFNTLRKILATPTPVPSKAYERSQGLNDVADRTTEKKNTQTQKNQVNKKRKNKK